MPKLRVLSGKDIIEICFRFGFSVISQKGSHIKLARIKSGLKETITVPNHRELDKGTTKAIHRQLSKYVDLELLERHFYSQD
jgi:predicted RNA binding protein YcfA (HicA-like mRNA interferase family)